MATGEAKLPLLRDLLDAANTAFQIGYESSSQLSRKYSRLFGGWRLRDIMNLRQMTADEMA